MGLFNGMGQAREERLKLRKAKAERNLAYYKELDEVRTKERKTSELRFKPVKEKATQLQKNLKALRSKAKTGKKDDSTRRVYGDVFGSSDGDRVRSIFYGKK